MLRVLFRALNQEKGTMFTRIAYEIEKNTAVTLLVALLQSFSHAYSSKSKYDWFFWLHKPSKKKYFELSHLANLTTDEIVLIQSVVVSGVGPRRAERDVPPEGGPAARAPRPPADTHAAEHAAASTHLPRGQDRQGNVLRQIYLIPADRYTDERLNRITL